MDTGDELFETENNALQDIARGGEADVDPSD